MKLIVGLGNKGLEYKNTRHNVGFMVLDVLADFFHVSIDKTKFNGEYADVLVNGEKIIFLKPLSYMNLSGEVVKKYVDFYKISIDDILIIHDDLDLPLGGIKLKYKGSSGGHNGLKNIELNLGTSCYKRVKIGISNNKKIDTKDYVLGHFSLEEQNILHSILKEMPNLFHDYLEMPFDSVMSKYNRKQS